MTSAVSRYTCAAGAVQIIDIGGGMRYVGVPCIGDIDTALEQNAYRCIMTGPFTHPAGRARSLLVLAMAVLLAASGVLHMAAGDHSAHGHAEAHTHSDPVSHVAGGYGCEVSGHADDERNSPCAASSCPLCVPASAVASADTAVERLVRDDGLISPPASRLTRFYRPPRTPAT